MKLKTQNSLSESILKEVFPKEKLPQNGASMLPLFNEMYLDLLAAMLKMESITDAVFNRFTFEADDKQYPFTFSIRDTFFKSIHSSPEIPMKGSVEFNCGVANCEAIMERLIADAIPTLRGADLNFDKYKERATQCIKKINPEYLSDSDHTYYIGPRPVQQTVREMQKVRFSVVEKFGKKFFRIFLYSDEEMGEKSRKEFFDYGVYFENLEVNVLPREGKIIVFRDNKIFDTGTVEVKWMPGERGDEPWSTFSFNTDINGKEDIQNFLGVKKFKLGDIVEIDWELNKKEVQDIQEHLNRQHNPISPKKVPDEVRRYFVKRMVPLSSNFTVFLQVLGSKY